MNKNHKKAIFVGECMIELNGDISSLGTSNSNRGGWVTVQ